MMILFIAAIVFFITHVILIFTSFGKRGYQPLRYFWSHSTLWIAGILLSVLLWTYSGSGVSAAADAFDTPLKKTLPVIIAFALSLIAHAVVKFLVMPHYSAGAKGGR
jgi:putative Mn2+ efflux pump MntP